MYVEESILAHGPNTSKCKAQRTVKMYAKGTQTYLFLIQIVKYVYEYSTFKLIQC